MWVVRRYIQLLPRGVHASKFISLTDAQTWDGKMKQNKKIVPVWYEGRLLRKDGGYVTLTELCEDPESAKAKALEGVEQLTDNEECKQKLKANVKVIELPDFEEEKTLGEVRSFREKHSELTEACC